MKPNIFTIATKELSQDGFFTWLIQWADPKNAVYDRELNIASQDLVLYLIKLAFSVDGVTIKTVETWRQWNYIDILVEVNEEFVIVIEDKVNSKEHSQQLERYKKIINDHYKGKHKRLIFVYLKTGNESLATLKKVKEKGFSIVDRKIILEILTRHSITNHIFTEFKEHLLDIEKQTTSYGTLKKITSVWRAAEGFYMLLQEKLDDGDWRYVANQSGGFLGFWYYWRGTDDYNLYIQIENYFENGIKLVVKIGGWTPNVSTLYSILQRLQKIGLSYGLKIIKPDRYRTGETSTLAIIEDAFPVDAEGLFDIDKFITVLKGVEQTLKTFTNDVATTSSQMSIKIT